jgi:hypothetical protein
MPTLKKGDKVRIRLDTASPYRGRTGVVDEEPIEDSFGFWYMVKFESKGYIRNYRFLEKDLVSVND